MHPHPHFNMSSKWLLIAGSNHGWLGVRQFRRVEHHLNFLAVTVYFVDVRVTKYLDEDIRYMTYRPTAYYYGDGWTLQASSWYLVGVFDIIIG